MLMKDFQKEVPYLIQNFNNNFSKEIIIAYEVKILQQMLLVEDIIV